MCVKKSVYGREKIVFQLMHTTTFPQVINRIYTD